MKSLKDFQNFLIRTCTSHLFNMISNNVLNITVQIHFMNKFSWEQHILSPDIWGKKSTNS